MGCTSSAPNMTPSISHSEKDLKFLEETEEKRVEQGEENGVNMDDKREEANRIQVLPTCDTLGGSTQLDRHSKTFVNTASGMDLEDSHMNGYVTEHKNENISKGTSNLIAHSEENLHTDEKLTTLEEVVEKIVELYVENGHEMKPTISEAAITEDKRVIKTEEHKEVEESEKHADVNETKQADEVAEEAASPSQSQSSRATRWEALADIAAELPPSLAVDPVTGQIYALK